MNRTLNRIKLAFLVVFAIGCVAIWAYQIFYVWPRDRCLAYGGWWDPATRICGTPIFLPKLTGRPIGSKPLADQSAPRVPPGVHKTSPTP